MHIIKSRQKYLNIHPFNVAFQNGVSAYNFPGMIIESNSVYWFEGPNGAGKTTLFDNLHRNLSTKKVKVSVIYQDYRSYLFEYHPIWWNIGLPMLIDGKDKKQVFTIATAISGQYGFNIQLKKKSHSLSGGEAQLVMLLRAILSRPDILLIDEPASGLDVVRSRMFWDTTLKLASQGTPVCVTSHQPPDVSSIKMIKQFEALNGTKIAIHELTENQ